MRIFDLLRLLEPLLTPQDTKIHLATSDGRENPLTLFQAGEFPEWQTRQTKKNFERPYVVALIALPQADHWLFGGAFAAEGCEWHEAISYHIYHLTELPACHELTGRLTACFRRPSRQSYLNAENWWEQIRLDAIREEPIRMAEFPGYHAIDISREELQFIIAKAIPSWHSALSSVAGVYLISDTQTGKLYVGSATGEGGIWQRWIDYATNGHGGNREMEELLRQEGPQRAAAFRFTILEIADPRESQESILQRESHWKNVLMSRTYGLNAN